MNSYSFMMPDVFSPETDFDKRINNQETVFDNRATIIFREDMNSVFEQL